MAVANGQCSPLYTAASKGFVDIVQLLIDQGASVNHGTASSGATPLFIACQLGQCAAVEVLLNAKADASLSDSTGATPLYVACQNGHLATVELLLRLCPSAAAVGLNLAKATGATPLYVAAQKGHAAIARRLLAAGAAVNQCTNAGASPLLVAALQGHSDAVELLLESSADPDLPTADGTTPLIAVCANDEPPPASIPRALLKAGATVALADGSLTRSGLAVIAAAHRWDDDALLASFDECLPADSAGSAGSSLASSSAASSMGPGSPLAGRLASLAGGGTRHAEPRREQTGPLPSPPPSQPPPQAQLSAPGAQVGGLQVSVAQLAEAAGDASGERDPERGAEAPPAIASPSGAASAPGGREASAASVPPPAQPHEQLPTAASRSADLGDVAESVHAPSQDEPATAGAPATSAAAAAPAASADATARTTTPPGSADDEEAPRGDAPSDLSDGSEEEATSARGHAAAAVKADGASSRREDEGSEDDAVDPAERAAANASLRQAIDAADLDELRAAIERHVRIASRAVLADARQLRDRLREKLRKAAQQRRRVREQARAELQREHVRARAEANDFLRAALALQDLVHADGVEALRAAVTAAETSSRVLGSLDPLGAEQRLRAAQERLRRLEEEAKEAEAAEAAEAEAAKGEAAAAAEVTDGALVEAAPEGAPPRTRKRGECAVCMDSSNTHVLVPCGHKCVCAGCAELIKSQGACPMCRAQVVWVCEVYET